MLLPETLAPPRRVSLLQMPTVLLVEDDVELARITQEYLVQHDFEVFIEARGDRAERRVRSLRPDIVILDIGLPGLDGFEVCRNLRTWFNGPILVLTARGDDTDQVVGLELGADDYVAKPAKPRVLLARLRSLLRRPARPNQSRIEVGDLVVDPSTREVTVGGRRVDFTTGEFDLLFILASRAGVVVSREDIMAAMRGIAYDGLDRSIDLRISRLRKKLGDATRPQRLIKSIRGVGYLLAPPT